MKSSISKSSDGKPHKPAIAIAGLLCLINGLLLYLSSADHSGDGGFGTKDNQGQINTQKEDTVLFVLKNDQIFYQEQQISFEEFMKHVKQLQQEKQLPELFFDVPTLSSGFYEKVRMNMAEHNILYRQRTEMPAQNQIMSTEK